MSRRWMLAWAGWSVLCLLLGLGPARAEVVIVDEQGQQLRWDTAPRRVVSLLPSLTETVCELGACAWLVGVDRYSNWPASVQKLPRLGGGMDPNVEAIVALKPDVVLIAGSSRSVEPLRALGLQVVVLEPKNTADVKRVLGTVAHLLGQPPQAAERAWARIDEAVAAQARSLPARVSQSRVYFEVNSAPYGAGESSFIGEIISRLGPRNILPASMGPFPQVNPEFVVRANPDVILVGDHNATVLPQRPGWGAIRAVREQRVCIFKPHESDVLVRPGPRLGEAAALVARCLREKAP